MKTSAVLLVLAAGLLLSQAATDDICLLPKEAGMCLAFIPRYYYNSTKQECDKFIYGGCQGNENNFKDLESCEAACKKKVDRCLLPKDAGLCQAYFPRYYYDSTKQKCDKFIYGGCQGNENNFKDLESCEAACKKKVDRCQLPKDAGLCQAYIPRYYYDSSKQKCDKFIYGGCQGNENNFKDLASCEAACKKKVDRCLLCKESGPCEAYIESFYFDKDKKQCVKFIYGGCGGNDNRFATKKDCEKACLI